MRVMVISDLHYEKRVFRGVDESRALSWLMEVVDYHRPDLLLSCGDWGSAINPEEFYELLGKTIVLSIYGNHENLEVLKTLYNVRSDNYLPVLMEDSKVYEFGGLKIAGISGIIARKRKVRKGVPRKTPDEYLSIAGGLKGKEVDVMLIHETPYLPNLFPFIRDSFSSRTALEAVEIVKPRLVFNGHVHAGGYRIYEFSFGTKYIFIDSSQANKHYVILYTDSMKLEIWRDREAIEQQTL